MELAGKNLIITGAASGIGAALARRFAAENPAALVLGDIDLAGLKTVAEETGGVPVEVDVSSREDNFALVDLAEDRFGPVDLFCANAGVAIAGDEQTSVEEWDRLWDVNLMSHVHAAARLVPGWLARGSGYLLVTASAAGLLTNLKAAQYSVTKHAAVAFAEWLSITYGDQGIKVSCLCPMGVATPLLEAAHELKPLLEPDSLTPEQVAESVVTGIGDESFLILPHPEVERFFKNKAADYDEWLAGMRRLQSAVFPM